jgi:hypothetical protein
MLGSLEPSIFTSSFNYSFSVCENGSSLAILKLNGYFSWVLGNKLNAHDSAFTPFCRDLYAASRAETAEATVAKLGRERGEKRDHTLVALHKHFSNARRSSEVSVDLEGRMGVKQVGKR